MAGGVKLPSVGFVEEIDSSELKYGETVGRGAFGTVSKAEWRGITVAVKQIETENEKRAFVQELKQLSRVNHENIVKLYGASTKYPVCLVMEFAECGSLYHLLHSSELSYVQYTSAHVVSWCLQTAVGVAYLHNMKPKAIIHRDLKPPNLLLVNNGLVVKICDFGTAADYQTHMTNNKGSAAWMAPEVFEGNRYSEKCDVFSWGIVLWECFSRKKPFDDIAGNPFRIMWAVHSGTRPPLLRGMPEPLETLMTRCWSKNPAERPSMDEVVRIMRLVMPIYNDLVTPIKFGGFFLEEDADDDTDNNLGLTIHELPSPDDADAPGSVTPSRQMSHRNSEVVLVEPPEQESPQIEVVEARRSSLRSSLTGSICGMERESPCSSAPQPLSADPKDLFSPRNVVSQHEDLQKRHSADIEHLVPVMESLDMKEVTPQPPPRRRGHRRVGSHGNPPIKLDYIPQSQPIAITNPYNRMSTSVSHTGEFYSERNIESHPVLTHSSSWAPDRRPPSDYGMATSLGSQSTPSPSFSQLDDSLKPLQPLPNSPASTVIYYEHVDLAEKYIALQHHVELTRQKVEELKRKLDEERRKKEKNDKLIEEFQRLADENDEYNKWKESLQKQIQEERFTRQVL